jgi:hypothetical protein
VNQKVISTTSASFVLMVHCNLSIFCSPRNLNPASGCPDRGQSLLLTGTLCHDIKHTFLIPIRCCRTKAVDVRELVRNLPHAEPDTWQSTLGMLVAPLNQRTHALPNVNTIEERLGSGMSLLYTKILSNFWVNGIQTRMWNCHQTESKRNPFILSAITVIQRC